MTPSRQRERPEMLMEVGAMLDVAYRRVFLMRTVTFNK